LLVPLIGLHVALAAHFHISRNGLPVDHYHRHYKEIIELNRMLDGYHPVDPNVQFSPGFDTYYMADRTEVRWTNPGVLFDEVTRGRLRGLWRNHDGVFYWNEIPTPFFISALVARLTRDAILVELSPMLYLALLLVAVYGIGRLAAGPWEGLAAACVVSGYPVVFGYARILNDTTSAAALALLLVYLLLGSDGFGKLRYALGAGVAGAMAARTGETLAATILIGTMAVGPFLGQLWILTKRFLALEKRWWRGLFGLGLTLAPLLLVVEAARFPPALEHMLGGMEDYSGGLRLHGPYVGPGHRLANLLVYPFRIAVELLGPWMTAWVVTGLALLARARVRHRLALLLMFALPLVGLGLMTRKATWYIAPLLPTLAVLTVLGLQGVPRTTRRGIPEWLPPMFNWRGAATFAAAACGIASLLFACALPPQARDRLMLRNLAPTFYTSLVVDTVELIPKHDAADISLRSALADMMEYLEREVPVTDRPYLFGLLGANFSQTFRFAIEVERPDILMVDLAYPGHYQVAVPFTHEEITRFDGVIVLSNAGFGDWDAYDAEEVFPSQSDLHPDTARRFVTVVERLRHRPSTRIDLHSGPIFHLW